MSADAIVQVRRARAVTFSLSAASSGVIGNAHSLFQYRSKLREISRVTGPKVSTSRSANSVSLGSAEILVAQIAPADDCADVIRDPRFVVHAAIQTLSVCDELEQRAGPKLRPANGLNTRTSMPGTEANRARSRRVSRSVQIVDQQANADAASRGIDQFTQQQDAAFIVENRVVLHIQRARGPPCKANARGERFHALTRAETGLIVPARSVGRTFRCHSLRQRCRSRRPDHVRRSRRRVRLRRGRAGPATSCQRESQAIEDCSDEHDASLLV